MKKTSTRRSILGDVEFLSYQARIPLYAIDAPDSSSQARLHLEMQTVLDEREIEGKYLGKKGVGDSK